MPGFLITNISSDFCISNYDDKRCVYNEMFYKKWKIEQNTLNKFIDDKIFIENNEIIAITEGVILNKSDLLKKYKCSELFDLIIKLRKSNKEFFNEFRGSFSGAIYDKKRKNWTIYTNHYGDNAIFYYNKNGTVIIASDINYIITILKKNQIKYSLDEKALYYLLTYSFMGDDSTSVSEIKRLSPGNVIQLTEDGSLEIKEYYRLCKNKYDLSNWTNAQLIDKLDKLFREAIRLEYEKDIEYGYEHLTDLSGGLDSRMNAWVACDMGYHNMTNITYCQSGATDEIVSKQISKTLNTKHIFYPLDNAECMMHIDTNVLLTSGLVIYSSITGGKKILEELDPNKFGIEHTGQLGDVIIGTYLTSPKECFKNTTGGMYTDRLKEKITEKPFDNYQDYEQYMLYVRGFRGILSSHFIRRNFVEPISPFLNIELMEFCLSMSIEARIGHKIYFEWVKKKYPGAAKFVWESRGVSLFAPKWKEYLYRIIHNGPNKILRMLKLEKPKPTGMNPVDYWYQTNSDLKDFFDNYFEENISNSNISKKIKEDMTCMYRNESVTGKAQVLTVLSIVKQYFSNV
ncbi:MAG: hypothetical protein RR697_03875 [Malacoplasma sp.]